VDGGRDINIRPDLWENFQLLAELGDWPSHCARARNAAEQVIRSDPDVNERRSLCVAQLRARSISTLNIFASRIQRLAGPARDAEQRMADFEERINSLLIEGVEHPGIRVDSVGVVVVASTLLDDK
jgi:hypothetical protein